jgi:hypothetical protein
VLRFITMTALLTAIITATVLIGVNKGVFLQPSFFREIVIFLCLSTVGLYWFTVERMEGKPEDFVKIYLGATVLRILFFGGFIFTVMQLDTAGAIENTVFFLVSYFLFTILEVVVLFWKIKSPKTPKTAQKDL